MSTLAKLTPKKAHHERRDDLVDPVTRFQERRNERPGRADRNGDEKGQDNGRDRRHEGQEGGRQGRHEHRGQEELAVDTEIPKPGTERNDEPGRDEQQGRHAGNRRLEARRAEKAALENIAIVGDRVLAQDDKQDRARAQCQNDRQ